MTRWRPATTSARAAVWLATAALLVGCGTGSVAPAAPDASPNAPPDSPPSAARSATPGPVPAPRRPASVEPPASGALFGAYVDPGRYTESDRIAAVERFEQQLGRRLALYHDYHRWTDRFPTASDRYFAERGTTLLLSWAGTDTRRIISGADDELIRARARAILALDRPVLLRWRWEMNRPNLADQIHSGADYIGAWRHLHDLFASVGADAAHGVAWVWCPLADEGADADFDAYYPGDGYVDWLCADGYARSDTQSFADVFQPFLTWAAGRPEPVLIGEFGHTAGYPGVRAAWLEDARSFVEGHPQIKAVSYFESPSGASGDYAVSTDASSLAALRDWAQDPYFDPH